MRNALVCFSLTSEILTTQSKLTPTTNVGLVVCEKNNAKAKRTKTRPDIWRREKAQKACPVLRDTTKRKKV